MTAPTATARRTARSAAVRWIAALLLVVASPCASELVLGAVASAIDDDATVVEACCADDAPTQDAPAQDSSHRHSAPDERAACACCHAFQVDAPAPALVTPTHVATAPTFARPRGAPIDGHRERLFRPPACA